MFTFIALNYYGASEERSVYQFDIQSKSSISGTKRHRHERKPTVVIKYFGFEKELVFDYKDTDHVEMATKVHLAVRRGLFGFDVLDNFEVVDE